MDTTLENALATAQDGARASAELSRAARRSTVKMIHRTGEGHYGGSLSVVDILATLYQGFVDPKRSDRVILSKGHGAPGYYAVLANCGRLAEEKLSRYGETGSPLQGHPDMTTEPAVDFSTGSLGQGLSVGLGMALAAASPLRRVWVILGDGECQEGQVWEAAMLAGRLGVRGLAAVIDCNGHQEWGFRTDGRATEPVLGLRQKWEAFGWTVIEADGHDHRQLWDAFSTVQTAIGPVVVIAKTVKGKSVSLIESDPDRFHCAALTPDEFEQVLEGLS